MVAPSNQGLGSDAPLAAGEATELISGIVEGLRRVLDGSGDVLHGIATSQESRARAIRFGRQQLDHLGDRVLAISPPIVRLVVFGKCVTATSAVGMLSWLCEFVCRMSMNVASGTVKGSSSDEVAAGIGTQITVEQLEDLRRQSEVEIAMMSDWEARQDSSEAAVSGADADCAQRESSDARPESLAGGQWADMSQPRCDRKGILLGADHLRILSVLARDGGPMAKADLVARVTGVGVRTIERRLSELKSNGYVIRIRRGVWKVTKKGCGCLPDP